MKRPRSRCSRRVVALVTGAVAAILALGWLAGTWWDHEHSGQALVIRGGTIGFMSPRPAPPSPTPTPPSPAQPSPQALAAGSGRLVSGVSANGRYFVDAAGQPVLVKGDSPWSLLLDASPSQAATYFRSRQDLGTNAVLVSLLGAVANGGPSDDGATFDGILPFEDGDVTNRNPAYWQRAHDYVQLAADTGITVFLYAVDGWTIGKSFVPSQQSDCLEYGRQVGAWAADLPNVVWMTGGDYFPQVDDLSRGSDVDHCFANIRTGLDEASTRPFSIQLGYPRSISSENPYWSSRVDFNFVYTYLPTYDAVRQAYEAYPDRPALFGEGNYERENNDPDSPGTTDETLRRQAAWALTSGSPGDFYGSDDWEFLPGWEERLDTPALRQLAVIRTVLERLPWWTLSPDLDAELLVSGRGRETSPSDDVDVLESDVATAAVSADGTCAVLYVPTPREIGLDTSRLADGSQATWVDPTSGSPRPVDIEATMKTPGPNAAGAGDWLLVIQPAG